MVKIFKMIKIICITLQILIGSYSCQNINDYFEKINQETQKYNAIAAKIAWESSVDPGNTELPRKAVSYQKKRIQWQHSTCDKLVELNILQLLNNTQRRQTYLLCRGARYSFEEARETSNLYEELQTIYSDAQICIPAAKLTSIKNTKEAEDAILNYLSTVKQVLTLNSDSNDSISFAAKIAANEDNLNKEDAFCLNGEADFENLMKASNNEEVLRWLWLVWREKVGPPMKEPYDKLVKIENRAARRNGYSDIGATWRDELEVPKLRQLSRQLYSDIRPLYKLLHGVTRYFLRQHYGEIVPERGPIPAHLLGNLWSQNWEPLSVLITPDINIDESIKKLNWTVLDMVKRAEDFYQSLGLPPMTNTFWRESVFTRENHNRARCHGTAADMFKDGDYRLLYCSGTSAEDLYVIHHEMGHIQYYMAYEQQPGIFRQANTAFHESIGDTIMLGVMTPQHLHRLGLINDTILYAPNYIQNDDAFDLLETNENTEQMYETNDDFGTSNYRALEGNKKTRDYKTYERNKKTYKYLDRDENLNDRIDIDKTENYKMTIENHMQDISTDEILLFKLALNKIPQIPFALLLDEYRWRYFEGGLDESSLNREFWDMALKLQGIAPVGSRGEDYFDIGAKFHVPDNTPYIRYFLSSFIQHQLYESLCKTAVFGRRGVTEDLPSTITLNRCDIYGSKAVGKLLNDLTSRGSSQHWREILKETTGLDDISASALKRYYRPLYKLLVRLVDTHRIPIGW